MPAMGYFGGVFCLGIMGKRAEQTLGEQVQLSGSGRGLGAATDA